jgi:site-specific recombinase XerD
MNPLFAQFKTVRDLDDGPLCPHIPAYITQLQTQGYQPQTILKHLWLFAHFNRWLRRTDRSLRSLNEEIVKRFLRRHCAQRKRQLEEGGALYKLLNLLRKARVVPGVEKVPTTPAERLANQYQCYLLKERGCSAHTLENYGRHVNRFIAERFGNGPIRRSQLRAQDVIAFVQTGARQLGRGHASQRVTALRSFLGFLHYRGHTTTNLAAAVPAVAHWRMTGLPRHLSSKSVEKVLDSCDQTTAFGRRNYVILLLMARLGLRGGEIINLQLEDLDWETAQLTIHSKKSRSWTRLPMPGDVGKAVARYLRFDRPRCSSRNVFVRMVAPYQRLSKANILAKLTQTALKRAGVKCMRTGSHVFRHSLATEMLRRGASLEEIGQVLRHKNPDTTAIYAKVDLDALRQLAIIWPGGVQ